MSALTHVTMPQPEAADDRAAVLGILEAAYGPGVLRGEVLDWLYELNPVGPAARVVGSTEQGDRVSFAAAVPQRWAHADGRTPTIGLVVNIAISPDGRGRGGTGGLLRQLMEAGRERGWDSVWGAANDLSVGGLLKLPEYSLFRQMDTYLLPPGRRADRAEVTRLSATPGRWLLTSQAESWFELLEPTPRWGFAQRWQPDTLAWRLSRPGQRYALYQGPDASVVALRRRVAGLPVCVVAKILPHRGVTQVRAESLIDAVRSAERCVAAVYVGWNSRVRAPANRVPRRFLPSGLNVGGFDTSNGTWGWDVETYELLEGDQL